MCGIMGKYICNAISFDDILLQEYSWIMEKGMGSVEYTILHWLAILLQNRTFDIQSDFGEEAKKYLIEYFATDDGYFSFAQLTFTNSCFAEREVWQPRKFECDSRVRQGYFDSWKEPRKRERYIWAKPARRLPIQQYEQKQKNINHGRADYIVSLSKALHCRPEDLLEK